MPDQCGLLLLVFSWSKLLTSLSFLPVTAQPLLGATVKLINVSAVSGVATIQHEVQLFFH